MDPALLETYRQFVASAQKHVGDITVSGLNRTTLLRILRTLAIVLEVREENLFTEEEIVNLPKTKAQEDGLLAKLSALNAAIVSKEGVLTAESETETRALVAPEVLMDFVKEWEEAKARSQRTSEPLRNDAQFQNAQRRLSRRADDELADFLAKEISQTTGELTANLAATIETNREQVAQSLYENEGISQVLTDALPKNLPEEELLKTKLAIAVEVSQNATTAFSEGTLVGSEHRLAHLLETEIKKTVAAYTGRELFVSNQQLFSQATQTIAKAHIDGTYHAMVARRNIERILAAAPNDRHTAAFLAYFRGNERDLGPLGEEMVGSLTKTRGASLPRTQAFVRRVLTALDEQARRETPPSARPSDIESFAQDFSRKHAQTFAGLEKLYRLERLGKIFPAAPIPPSNKTLLFESQNLKDAPFPWAQLAMPTRAQLSIIYRMPLALGTGATLAALSRINPNTQYAWLLSLLHHDPNTLPKLERFYQNLQAQIGRLPDGFQKNLALLKLEGARLLLAEATNLAAHPTPATAAGGEYWRVAYLRDFIGDFSEENPRYSEFMEGFIDASSLARIQEELQRETKAHASQEHLPHGEIPLPPRTQREKNTSTAPSRGYVTRYITDSFQSRLKRLFGFDLVFDENGREKLKMRLWRLASNRLRNWFARFSGRLGMTTTRAATRGAWLFRLGSSLGRVFGNALFPLTRAASTLLGISRASLPTLVGGISNVIGGFLSGISRALFLGGRVVTTTGILLFSNPVSGAVIIAILLILFFVFIIVAIAIPAIQQQQTPSLPTVVLRDAPLVRFRGVDTATRQGESDSNSPAHWDGDTLYVFNAAYTTWRSAGTELFNLNSAYQPIVFDKQSSFDGGIWLEATYKEGGTLYGWYHHEPLNLCSQAPNLTAPQIGMAKSQDNGLAWQDLGFILDAPLPLNCDTKNGFFAGGNGDFTVLLDTRREYFYLFITSYSQSLSEQGIAVARLRYGDRDSPAGKVQKWHQGSWGQPGIGGRATPIFPAKINIHEDNADFFWGPSIHWNTHLNMYVILMNHAKDGNFSQEGINVSFSNDISNPNSWSLPQKIRTTTNWYPQVMGIDKMRQETDKFAGRVARYFEAGESRFEIVFLRPEESQAGSTVLDYAIPIRNTSIVVADPAGAKQAILREFPSAQLQYWDTIVSESIRNGWNSAFVLTLWIEETGASHHAKRDNGGGGIAPLTNGHLGCAPSENQTINESLTCLFRNFSGFTNNQFEAFMRRYSGEQATGPFINNPNFPARVKRYYSLLVPGGLIPVTPVLFPGGTTAPLPILAEIVQAAADIVRNLRQGADGLYNVKVDERGVYYWCTYLIVDSYNRAGLPGLTRGAHAAVVTMKAYFGNTQANGGRYQLLSADARIEQLRSGDVIFFEGRGQHVSLIKSHDIDENGNGVIRTYDSNNIVTEDIVFVRNHKATKAQTTARIYNITGFGQVTNQ